MNLSSIDSPSRRLTRRNGEILVSFVLALMACISSAQTFQGDSAYQQLIRAADPSAIVEVNGQRYVRAPQGVDGLPGGYSGAFEKRKITLPTGQDVEIIDPATLRITKDTKPAQQVQLPERGMKIVAAMEKMGLHPKTYLLPQAVGGYRIWAIIGGEKPGSTITNLFIHIGEEQKVKVLAKLGFPEGKVANPKPTPQIRKVALTSSWAGEISQRTANDGLGIVEREVWNPGRAHDYYLVGWAAAYARRNDVVLHAKINRTDTLEKFVFYKTLPPIKTFSKDDPASGGLTHYQQRTRYWEGHYAARCVALSEGLDVECENWLKVLAKIVDDVDRGTAAPALASTTPPKPPEPSTSKDKPKPTARIIFGKGPVLAVKPPPRPGVGERLQNWWEGVEDYAADNPNRWAGWCLTSSGTAVMAVGLFVPGVGWTAIGAGLFTCGVGAYHGGKAQPPPEIAIVTQAREQLQRYQKEWKHGFTDTELNELGIFMDDLSKLTPAQRRQVYKDADVEFTTRAEAFRQMREDEARQGRPGG